MTTITNTAAAEVAVSAIRMLDAEIAKLQESRAKHVEKLLAATDGTGKVKVGAVEVTLSENNVYSEKVMREQLLPGQIKRVSKTVIDKSVVKRLYPDIYAAAKESRGRKVSVK